jgi:hypothetical protein
MAPVPIMPIFSNGPPLMSAPPCADNTLSKVLLGA